MIKIITINFLFAAISINTLVAQEVSNIPNNDSLNKIVVGLKKDVDVLKNLKVTGWVQAQFQIADTMGVKNLDGGDFPSNSNNRFMIRRGRIKFTYGQKNSQYVLQINATERGVNVADMYGKYTDPWLHAFSISGGVMNRPFGYDIQYSSADRESPERSRWTQTFLQNERDIGAMASFQPAKGNKLNGLKIDAGFFNGTGIAVPGTGIPAGSTAAVGITGVNGFTDFDKYKDFISHAVFYKTTKNEKIRYGLGTSYYNGGFALQNNKIYNSITKDSLGNNIWVIADTINKKFKDTKAPRIYYGIEALFSIKSIIGTTTIRGEYFMGTQTGKDNDTRSPQFTPNPASAMYIRNFNAGYVYFIQRIGKSKHEVVFKYDFYDPNTKIVSADLNGKNGMKEGEIKYTSVSFGYNFYLDNNVKFMLNYNIVTNEVTKITGYSRDLKDNILTIRMQYRF